MTLPGLGRCIRPDECINSFTLGSDTNLCICSDDDTTIWVEDSTEDYGGTCDNKPACTAHESTHYLVKDETCICPSEGEGEKSEEKVVKEG